MNEFWENVFRYPRFFISSMIGLILIVLAPFKNLFKIPKLRVLLFLSFLIIFSTLCLIIQKIIGL